MSQEEARKMERLRFAIEHEIRGTITVAKGYAEFARKGKFGSLEPKVVQAFESIERVADKVTIIATNLNELIRFEYQSASIVKKSINNLEFCKKALKNVSLEAKKRKISIESSLTDDLKLSADMKALELVLTNLLRNAIQFSPEGKQVVLTLESTPNELQIVVKNEGVGLSASDIENLWTRPEEIRPEFGRQGACIGLHVCHIIIAHHGGSIEATSDGIGKGSKFLVRLPLSK